MLNQADVAKRLNLKDANQLYILNGIPRGKYTGLLSCYPAYGIYFRFSPRR